MGYGEGKSVGWRLLVLIVHQAWSKACIAIINLKVFVSCCGMTNDSIVDHEYLVCQARCGNYNQATSNAMGKLIWRSSTMKWIESEQVLSQFGLLASLCVLPRLFFNCAMTFCKSPKRLLCHFWPRYRVASSVVAKYPSLTSRVVISLTEVSVTYIGRHVVDGFSDLFCRLRSSG